MDGVKRTVQLQGGSNTLVQAVDDDADLDDIGLTLSTATPTRPCRWPPATEKDPTPRSSTAISGSASLNRTISLPYERRQPDGALPGHWAASLTLGGAELIWSGAELDHLPEPRR